MFLKLLLKPCIWNRMFIVFSMNLSLLILNIVLISSFEIVFSSFKIKVQMVILLTEGLCL